MKRSAESDLLLAYAGDLLETIRRHYEACAVTRRVTPELLVSVKIFAEQVRSALDYLALDIREMTGPAVRPGERTYFPVAKSPARFAQHMKKNFPGLQQTAPKVYEFLESLQPYQPDQKWLGSFIELVNTGKHRNLAVHEIREEVAVRGTWDTLGPLVMHVSAAEQGMDHDSWIEFVFPGYGNALLLLLEVLEDARRIHSRLHQILPGPRRAV